MPNSTRFAARRRGLLGLAHLDKFAGGPRSAMQDFLLFLSKKDVFYHEHDFMATAIDTTFWTTNALTGATAFATPGTQALGGTVQGATGTNGTESNRNVNMYGNRIFTGDAYCGMEVRLKVGAAASNIEWGVGFLDTITTITTPVVLCPNTDTPSFATGVGDAAVVYMDTGQTLTTAALNTLGSTPYAAANTPIGTFAPTAATYFTVRIQLDGDTVYCAVEDANGSYTEVTKVNGIEGGTLVRPIIDVSGPTATTKTWDIDRWALWGMR